MVIEGLPHVIAFQNQGENKIEPAPECRKILKFKKIHLYENNSNCCIWYENISGRTGNDLSSALRKILNKVIIDFPEANRILTWSMHTSKSKPNDGIFHCRLFKK